MKLSSLHTKRMANGNRVEFHIQEQKDNFLRSNEKTTSIDRAFWAAKSHQARKKVVYLPAATNPDGTWKMTGPLAPKEKEDW